MAFSLLRVDRLTQAQALQCQALQAACGPVNGKAPARGGRAWLALDDAGVVVAFTIVRRTTRGRYLHVANQVVAPAARGNGLQAAMLRRVVAYAMELGLDGVRTYTAGDNWYSAANVVRVGFKVERLEPSQESAAAGVWVHWRWGLVA